jgi:hypothetical protein
MAMKRVLVVAAACAACLVVPLQGSAGDRRAVTCSQETNAFSGTARDLIVPEGGFCEISAAAITHDLIVEEDAEADVSETTIGHDLRADTGANLHLERTSIGHDFVASEPQTVQTGHNSRESAGGAVSVGHDFVIHGSPEGFDFVFDGVCYANVGHDFRITDREVTLGFGIGDNCVANGLVANTIGHDLIVVGNAALAGVFGPSALEVGGNRVGHDLVFSHNTAAPGGYLEVADNVVGHDAICKANSPAPSRDAADGPNFAGHRNTCG